LAVAKNDFFIKFHFSFQDFGESMISIVAGELKVLYSVNYYSNQNWQHFKINILAYFYMTTPCSGAPKNSIIFFINQKA
jgi:hypothetical protein